MKEKFKKFLPWIILVLALVGLVLWYVFSRRVTETQQSNYDQIIKEAESNYHSKDYSVALNKYYQATEVIAQDLKAYKGIVDILLLKNRPEDAVTIIRKSTRALSSDERSRLYELVGDYYYSLLDYERAKEFYQEGLTLGVTNSSAELKLGKSLLNLGRIEDGMKQIEKQKYEGEDAVEANLLLSYIYALDDVDRAKSQIASITADGKWNPFYDEFDTVLKSFDDDKKFNTVKLSRVYINTGYPHLALSALISLESEITEYLDGIYFLGRANLEAKNYQKAVEYLDKALSLGGMESQIFWDKARAYYYQNDLDNALNCYSRSLEYIGKNATEEFVREYMDILLRNKQNLKATEVVKLVLTTTEKPYIYLLGIESNYVTGEKAKIDYYLQQLEKLDLTDIEQKEYLYWKTRVLIDANDIENAKIFVDRLVAKDKYNPKCYLLLGMIEMKESKPENAKKSYEKSLEYDLNNEVSDEVTKLLFNLK